MFEAVEDLFRSFGPDEWFRVLIPALDPVADVGFEGVDAAVVAALQEIGGDVGEEPFDLVDPGRVGRGEVHVESGVHVDEARAAGSVRDHIDARTTTRLLFGMINSIVEWFRPGGPLTAKELADDVVKVAFEGILRAR